MSWLPLSILPKTGTQSVAADATLQPVSNEAHVTPEGAERLRLTFFIGRVTVTNDIVLGMEQMSGYSLWTTTKTDDTVTTKSAADTFTAATTDIITASSHGFSDGDAFVVDNSGGALPGGLATGTAYYVKVIDSNTFYLHTGSSLTPENQVDITSTGSGTHSLYAISQISITFNPEVSGDQAYIPLKHKIRAYATTGTDDTIDVIDVLLEQER